MIPVIETERLRLRGWSDQDLDPVAAFWADEDAARFVGGPKSRDESWRVIALYLGHWQLRGFGPFAVEEKASGRLVGWSGGWFPSGWPEPEILWSLLPAFGAAVTRPRRRGPYEAMCTAISAGRPRSA